MKKEPSLKQNGWYFKSYSNLIASSHKKLIFAWEILKALFSSERVNNY